jgi:integrase
MRILTREEFARLHEAIHAHYKPLVMFLAGTGCRWGEAVALTVADLRLADHLVFIRRALKWSPDNDRKIGPTKTRKSKRTVALPAVLVVELRELAVGRKPSDLVFTAPKGGPIHHRTFWSVIWLPACKAAELVPRPRPHPLRCPNTTPSWGNHERTGTSGTDRLRLEQPPPQH